jgi:hypothetical protein
MSTAVLRKDAIAAAMTGAALAALLALAIAPQDATSRVFDAIEDLCSGLAPSAHEATPGLYMPMFKTPPKGGPVYNGPPLDDC